MLSKNAKLQNEKQIISSETSAIINSMLRKVVSNKRGTASFADKIGYEVGGKTGTSELLNPEGGYYKDRNRTSFIAVFPVNNPRYIIYTAIEYPKKPKESKQRMTGAVVNAPLVKKIIFEINHYVREREKKQTRERESRD